MGRRSSTLAPQLLDFPVTMTSQGSQLVSPCIGYYSRALAMSLAFPPYLRLHTDPEVHNGPAPATLPAFAELDNAFQRITGWQLAYHESTTSWHRRRDLGTDVPIEGQLAIDDLSANLDPGQTAANRQNCEQLVASLNKVLHQRDRFARTAWELNAELAATFPIAVRAKSRRPFAHLLVTLLKSAVRSAGCDRGGLYLFDSDDRQIVLRSSYNLADIPADQAIRAVAHCTFDLKAMQTGAAIVDRVTPGGHQVPFECESAACVGLAWDETPLGTLWAGAQPQRTFSARDIQSMQLHAGWIGAELARHSLGRQLLALRQPASKTKGQRAGALVKPELESIDAAVAYINAGPAFQAVCDWGISAAGRFVYFLASDAGCGPQTVDRARTAFRTLIGGCDEIQVIMARIADVLETMNSNVQGLQVHVGALSDDGLGQFELLTNHHGAAWHSAGAIEFQKTEADSIMGSISLGRGRLQRGEYIALFASQADAQSTFRCSRRHQLAQFPARKLAEHLVAIAATSSELSSHSRPLIVLRRL